MEIRDALISIRNENKLSQQEFADMLEVSRSTVTRWEAGKSIPSSSQIMKICKLFNLDSNELLSLTAGEEAKPAEKPEKEEKTSSDRKYTLIYALFGALILLAVAGLVITIIYAVKDGVYDTSSTVWIMTIPANTPMIVLSAFLAIFIGLLVMLLVYLIRGNRK